jgi:hypothetical protein
VLTPESSELCGIEVVRQVALHSSQESGSMSQLYHRKKHGWLAGSLIWPIKLPSPDQRIISTMTLKSAACFALIGMILLTVLLAVGFIRDVSALLAGAIATMAVLASLIHLLAGLSVTVFLYVFYKAQS